MDLQSFHINWTWKLESNPEQIWPFISDTNRLFGDLKLPPVQKTELSYDSKKNHLQLSYSGLQNFEAWEEEPYEWEYPYRYGVRRYYKNGPCKYLRIRVDLIPYKKGARIHYKIWLTPKNRFASLLLKIKLDTIFKIRLNRTLKEYDYLAANGKMPYELAMPVRISHTAQKRIGLIRDAIVSAVGAPDLAGRLIDYICRADDFDLEHIRPIELARRWKVSSRRLLAVFLHATREGLLNFSWDLYCPRCRTIQVRCKTLNEIHEPFFCHDCSRKFEVNFTKTVQLSFRPNPLIRKLSSARYCLSGPQTKPHIVIQQYLKPREKCYLRTNLPEGEYSFRTSGEPGEIRVRTAKHAEDSITIALTDAGLENQEVTISEDPNLVFENRTRHPQIFYLEKSWWDREALAAAEITSRQIFRDLFADEVLQKGAKIAVDNLTLMFTDLLDSTGMYDKEGDDKAVGRVIDHFEVLQEIVAEQDGAIVKTIGDSIMAVFSHPAKAVRTFIKAREIITGDNRFDRSLKLKAGIHTGKCVAVNLNSRIDYFGSTVNIASRLAEIAEENEMVLSDPVAGHVEVTELIESQKTQVTVKNMHTRLRGFDNTSFSLKRVSLESSPLRLVV